MHQHLIHIAATAAKEPLPPAVAELVGAVAVGLLLVLLWTIIKSIFS